MEIKKNFLNELLDGIMAERYFDTLAQQQAAANEAYYRPIPEQTENVPQTPAPQITAYVPESTKPIQTVKRATETVNPPSPRLALNAAQLVQGIILAEILDKPVSLRPGRDRFHK